MFTKKDVAFLKEMFEDTKRDIRDETHSCIAASEARTIAEISQLRSDIIELTHNSILPQISELQNEDIHIKKFVGMV